MHTDLQTERKLCMQTHMQQNYFLSDDSNYHPAETILAVKSFLDHMIEIRHIFGP